MSVFASRLERAAQALAPLDVTVLVSAGKPLSIPGGQDQTYPFVPHPHYRWLTGSARPGGVLAFDPASGWRDFRVPVSAAEQVWEGAQPLSGAFPNVEELESWLGERPRLAVIGCGGGRVSSDAELEAEAFARLEHLRRPKDADEVSLVEQAVQATQAGFERIPEWLGPGRSEWEVGVRLEATFFMAGAQKTGYGTIVGSGKNSAVLHWPPTYRRMHEGELVLVDAGAEIDGYTADVTRVYPVSGSWSARQSDLYEMLLAAQLQAIHGCRIGVEWGELHVATALQIARGLRELGVLQCSPEEAVESEAIALFFPHGLGHMVGMGVRDASGVSPGRKEPRHFAGVRVRMDLPLEENYLVTVEPGVYFIPALLHDKEKRDRHAGRVAWDALEPWIELGGMRVEDNILVTAQGPRNLTRGIPK